jgi:serine O-acetyltransferase
MITNARNPSLDDQSAVRELEHAENAPIQADALRDHFEKKHSAWNLDSIVAQLRLSREVTHNIRHNGRIRRTPSRETMVEILDNLSAALFPSHYSKRTVIGSENIDYFVGHALNDALQLLSRQIAYSLVFVRDEEAEANIEHRARSITRDFAAQLPTIRGLLVSDLRAAFDGDPAATNFPEILLGYPGMTAIVHYRLAHALHQLGATLLARIVSDIAHSQTGIDIHPGAQIGPSFFVDHGTGVVIGETAIIGARVRLYQGVTLGAKSFPAGEDGALLKGAPRHPIVEDDVVIYARATILGRVTIGRRSTIGGNVWITKSIPADSHIVYVPPSAVTST